MLNTALCCVLLTLATNVLYIFSSLCMLFGLTICSNQDINVYQYHQDINEDFIQDFHKEKGVGMGLPGSRGITASLILY